ncbi:MAG TPA: radical SAM protein [Anaerolineaceae bacterium]
MRPLDASYDPGKARRRHHSTQKTAPEPAGAAASVPVLYLHPAKQGPNFRPEADTGRPYGLIPLGLPALVNVLRANGIPVKGLIHPLEKQLDPDFSLENWLRSQPGARVILIDLHWYEHCYGAVETARLCKKVLPAAWTVLGGLSATGWADEILEQFPAVDFIIRGDAEQPLLELVRRLLASRTHEDVFDGLEAVPNLSYRQTSGASPVVTATPQSYTACTADLDTLDFVNLDFIEHYQEYFVHEYIVTDLTAARQALETHPFLGRWTCTARGCKFHCSYCGGSKESHKRLANRNGITTRSPEKVVDDLRQLQAQGVHQASMSYDIAVLGEDYWRPFFSLLRASGLKIGVYNEFFQMPERAFIEEYARSVDMTHSCVALSPLSGNERVRRLNGKHYSNDQLFDILDALAAHNFYLFIYFSMNLPGETAETFEESLELARSIYEFYPHPLLKILNTVHTLDPVSPMNLYPEKYGIQARMSTFMDFYNYCRDTRSGGPGARTELHRGFNLNESADRSLESMSNAWDRARQGREVSWWPVPPSW